MNIYQRLHRTLHSIHLTPPFIDIYQDIEQSEFGDFFNKIPNNGPSVAPARTPSENGITSLALHRSSRTRTIASFLGLSQHAIAVITAPYRRNQTYPFLSKERSSANNSSPAQATRRCTPLYFHVVQATIFI
jgi:hypothetical protein